MPIPVSYGTARYWAIHAFTWVDADGGRRPVRYRWEPDTGLQELSEQEAGGKSPEYLAKELRHRLSDGPIGFSLLVQLGEDADPTDGPMKPWPADRTEILAGRLRITTPVADQDHWAAQVCDPTHVTPGIELSDDPVLAFRNPAYAVSYERRTEGKYPTMPVRNITTTTLAAVRIFNGAVGLLNTIHD